MSLKSNSPSDSGVEQVLGRALALSADAPATVEQSAPAPPPPAAPNEEAEVLQASIKAGSLAQVIVAAIAVLGLLYLLKLVMVTTLTAMLLAFVLEPMVAGLACLKVPRALGALVAMVLMMALVGGLSYFFYNRAVDFARELPQYSGKIRSEIGKLRSQTKTIADGTRAIIEEPSSGKQRPMPVEVKQTPGLLGLFSKGAGAISELLLSCTFIPFLVYFMLTWKDHAHSSTVRLFPKEHRLAAHRTVGRITEMIRSFLVGNVLIGLINSMVSILLFWVLGIPFFYFLGVISGFVSLVPYLGAFLALLPPLAAGVGILSKGEAVTAVVVVVGIHLVTMNVLYPKLVGQRLQLNPLAVTLALLFWGWIWGAMGLILAVPLLGATKVVCDYVDSLRGLGQWLGGA